jgi:hypothetical protein
MCPSIWSFFLESLWIWILFFLLSHSATPPHHAYFDQKGLRGSCSKCTRARHVSIPTQNSSIPSLYVPIWRLKYSPFDMTSKDGLTILFTIQEQAFLYLKITVNNKESVSSLFTPSHIEFIFIFDSKLMA